MVHPGLQVQCLVLVVEVGLQQHVQVIHALQLTNLMQDAIDFLVLNPRPKLQVILVCVFQVGPQLLVVRIRTFTKGRVVPFRITFLGCPRTRVLICHCQQLLDREAAAALEFVRIIHDPSDDVWWCIIIDFDRVDHTLRPKAFHVGIRPTRRHCLVSAFATCRGSEKPEQEGIVVHGRVVALISVRYLCRPDTHELGDVLVFDFHVVRRRTVFSVITMFYDGVAVLVARGVLITIVQRMAFAKPSCRRDRSPVLQPQCNTSTDVVCVLDHAH